MGTFHHDKHELHGITVVVDTAGPEVFVGRCDDMDEERILLLDVDVHREEPGGLSKQEYLAKAARFGVWVRHARLLIPRERVTTVRPLGEL